MPDLTPLEVAEKLESLIDYAGDTLDDAIEFNLRHTVDTAAAYLRAIAAGEYAPVVHGRWIDDGRGHYCSNCRGYITNSQWVVYKNPHCPYCGSMMDGKDDSREAD